MKRITRIGEEKISPAKKKTRVAAYCRVSTSMEDQMLSLETQKAHYEDYIRKNPAWEYAGIYYDAGITGTKKEVRPALMKMIEDCENGLVDRIITKSISRFARNTTDCLEIVRKLLLLDIPVFFEKENIDTSSMESELLLSIMSSLAESESQSISENVKWGRRHQFMNGTYKCCMPPYGYDWDKENAVMVVNGEQAEVVRLIFDETLKGTGISDIVKMLQDRGIPGIKRKDRWNINTIIGMIRNERYVGDCLFQKSYTDSHYDRHVNHGEADQFYVRDHHEPIISREVFEAANAVLERRRKEKGIIPGAEKYRRRYPTSGKIRCGACGGSMRRKTYADTSRVVLACSVHLKDKEACPMRYVRYENVQKAFVRMMNKLAFSRNKILVPFEKELREQPQSSEYLEISRIDERIEDIGKRKKILEGLFSRGIISPASYTDEANSLTREAAELEKQKKALIFRTDRYNIYRKEIKSLIHFTNNAKEIEEFDGDAFEEFVDHVTVENLTEVTFHLKCGLELKERIDG